MTAQTIFYIILWLFVFEFLFTKTLDYLNTLNWSDKLPEELKDIYDEKNMQNQWNMKKQNIGFLVFLDDLLLL